MRTLSCVFYVFLLSLFGLSCFGFPTDNWPYSNYLVGRFGSSAPRSSSRSVRIRHSRRDLGASRMGHIDPLVLVPSEEEPPTRGQRSPKRNRPRNQRQSKQRLEPHVTLKAYRAPIVVRATAQQNSTNTIYFLKNDVYKGTILEQNFNLQFCRSRAECDAMRKRSAAKVVKLKINELNKDYVLFLRANNSSTRSYENVFVPEPYDSVTRKELELMKQVCRIGFKAATPDLEIIEKYNETENQLRLICRAKKGLPWPKLKWVREDKRGFSNRTTITYRKKNRLKLTIKNLSDQDLGSYTCEATGVGKKVSISKLVSKPRKQSDDPPCLENFCYNGGKCYRPREVNDQYCVCPDGFDGHQCEYKAVNVPVNRTTTDDE